ncbi:heat shock 70 kDa protein 12A-like [Mercenaria mercenaria]|uniref:heat shock 70 kDa protein 12A-like n=1 Tax=Mercenaria mercenaria TaxID=6596 RepID=UPI00234E37B9|nr:heat shock 70 kDa protein 12A-like [Mercenaria mercenaria]
MAAKGFDHFLPGIVVTAAIDLGTTLSGYAFAFRDNPYRVYASVWKSRTTGDFEAAKTPTTLLLRPSGEFDSFGMEAEEKYSELTEDDMHHGWFFFQNFKMELYKHKKLSRMTKLKDNEGKEMAAMDIFTMAIKYIKDKLTEETRLGKTDLEEHEILWVLTVPAIWSDAAKQFMREAAQKAGISGNQLKLVLEPEAASLYCQADYTRRDVQAGALVELKSFQVGLKYIVADLGGGTADIATHQVLEDGSLREIYRSTGDALGGNRVNIAFLTFLDNLFGEQVMSSFHRNARGDYLDFVREFECKKKLVKAEEPTAMKLRCPTSLIECLQETRKLTFQQCVEEERYKKLIELKRDKIQISPKLVNIFFNEPVEEIIKLLKEIIQAEKFEIDTVLLVGGFSDSPYVRERIVREIKREAPEIDVVKPLDAGLHVLKGAVLTTLRPNHISERISRYTYGFRVAVPFDERQHPEHLKDKRASGAEYCSDIFHKCIEIGQRLKFGDTIKCEFHGQREHIRSKLEACSTELYRSVLANPRYCTPEEGCERVGVVTHHPPMEGWGNIVMFTAEVYIGETEFKISVINGTTQELLETSIDFLDH